MAGVTLVDGTKSQTIRDRNVRVKSSGLSEKDVVLNARTKLNRAAVNGILLVAAVAGALTRSWLIFGIAVVVLSGLALHDGSIRTKSKRR
jgi:hypothetical protein